MYNINKFTFIRGYDLESKVEKNSASTEDYLEIIYEYTRENKSFKSVNIAKRLNISRASVSEALKKLSEQGYIIYEKYKPVILTEKGKKIAENVFLKHCTLCIFFEKYLNLSNEEAQINACRIEHVITDNAFSKIKEIVDNLKS